MTKRLCLFVLFAASSFAQNTPVFPAAVATNSDLFIGKNSAATTLATGINASTTSATVASGTGFSAPSLVSIDNEILAVCLVSGNTLTFGRSACPNIDGRGFDGSSAATHLSGRAVQGKIAAWLHNQLAAEVIAIQTKLHAEHVSVEDYGAVGDGSTSDCTGFQGAVASGAPLIYATRSRHYYAPCTITMQSNQTILFGASSSAGHRFNGFIIPDSSTLKTAGNVALIGQGSAMTTLQQIAGANQDFIRSNSFYSLFDSNNKFGVYGLTLSGLTIDGNGPNQTIVTKTITAVTAASPMAVTTSASHGYSSGNVVCQKLIIGKPEADGCFVVTVTGATTYTLNNSTTISPNVYASGGTATNSHGNCIAVYGVGYRFSDVYVQNCATNGILSGWDTEPDDNYTSVLDRVPAMLTDVGVDMAGFDGIRWHGPHDTYVHTLDVFSNQGWGVALDTLIGVSSATWNFATINSFANYSGAIYANGGMVGTGLTPTNGQVGMFGLYIGPNGGGSQIYGANLGGANSLEVNSVDNTVVGQCFSVTVTGTAACATLRTGKNNHLSINGELTGAVFMYSEIAETGRNRFQSLAYLSGGAALYDPAHPFTLNDIVDLGGNSSSDLWQEPRQFKSTMSTGTAPFTIASTTPVINLTASWPIYNSGGVQFPNSHEVIGAFTALNGASPSVATAAFSTPFTSAGSYLCYVTLSSTSSVTYSPGLTISSAAGLTLKGPNGATETWLYDCKGN